MATITFEVKTYEVKIARELNASADGLSLKFPAYILCRGDKYHVVVYILEKPVYCYLNSDSPNWNALYTGQEPVGEHEL